MAVAKKPRPITTNTLVDLSPVVLPESGMVDIVFKGEVKSVTVQLAKTLIDKGSAKLKV